MSRISFTPVTVRLNQGHVSVNRITDHILVDGVRSNRIVSTLVIGSDIVDHKGLEDSVCEAILRFATASKNIMSLAQKEEKIKELKEKDEASLSVSYSRKCNVCFSPNPETRAVLTACGHFLCMACVITMEQNGRLPCPFCRKSSAYVKVHEDVSETEEIEKDEEEAEEMVSELSITIADQSPSPSSPPSNLDARGSNSTRRRSSSQDSRSASPSSRRTSTLSSPDSAPEADSPGQTSEIDLNRSLFQHTVYVAHLPPGTTENGLKGLFGQDSQVIGIHVNEEAGFAFCDFENELSARNVCSAFHRFEYRGSILSVSMV